MRPVDPDAAARRGEFSFGEMLAATARRVVSREAAPACELPARLTVRPVRLGH